MSAIVTCGGLCPGLNNVIKAVTECLLNAYGAAKVFGIQFGYKGFLEETPFVETRFKPPGTPVVPEPALSPPKPGEGLLGLR